MLKTVQLGRNCGLKVSQLCLGTMNFGEPGRGHQGDWTLGLDDARPLFKAAIDRGLFYFDCADVYGIGASERVVGQLLRELLPRDAYVLATKIAMPMGRGANQGGLSRKHVLEGVDACLERLGLDYIDQLVIHRHPQGVPGHGGWQFAELQLTAQMHGWTQFVSMQNHYNLVYREEEREMNPYCVQSGVALMPWSPLARGILTGSYRGGFDAGSTARSQGGDRTRTQSLYRGDAVFPIAERVADVARRYGKAPAQIALAWLLSKPGVIAPVVGVSKVEQLDQLVAATQITLAAEDVLYLEECYRPVENLLSIGYS